MVAAYLRVSERCEGRTGTESQMGGSATVVDKTTEARETTIAVIERLLGTVTPRDFGFVLWDGTEWGDVGGTCTIVLNHPGALRSMFLPPTELTAGEAYLRGDFDVIGSMERAVEVGSAIVDSPPGLTELVALTAQLLRLPSRHASQIDSRAQLTGVEHSTERDKDAISYHYDVGNDFYRLFLDEQMTYSCGYFEHDGQDLDSAQRAKFDHICKKLRLEPGDRVLDIGCGWGGLLNHAARNYGAQGVGITLSEPQARHARERAREQGLADRVSFETLDYRQAGRLGSFDKLVSVGMFEHVGAAKLPEYFEQAYSLLKPGGLFLNHGIATFELGARMRKRSFIQRYVFPDGELEAISEVLTAAEKTGFEIRDVESLREHYATTLRHWVERLESNAHRAVDTVGETTYRVWRIYMSASASSFRHGKTTVFQTLMFKPNGDVAGLPLTRRYLYAD
jgi:cyclopropane-fatty-acyl-phospholipid synthase